MCKPSVLAISKAVEDGATAVVCASTGNTSASAAAYASRCGLKCFVLIDLKKEEAGYQDVGQMNMYLGYFENEENTKGDHPPIGIVLAKEKDELLVKYAMHGVSSQLFVSKYQLYLPNEQELRHEIESLYHKQENEKDDHV